MEAVSKMKNSATLGHQSQDNDASHPSGEPSVTTEVIIEAIINFKNLFLYSKTSNGVVQV